MRLGKLLGTIHSIKEEASNLLDKKLKSGIFLSCETMGESSGFRKMIQNLPPDYSYVGKAKESIIFNTILCSNFFHGIKFFKIIDGIVDHEDVIQINKTSQEVIEIKMIKKSARLIDNKKSFDLINFYIQERVRQLISLSMLDSGRFNYPNSVFLLFICQVADHSDFIREGNVFVLKEKEKVIAKIKSFLDNPSKIENIYEFELKESYELIHDHLVNSTTFFDLSFEEYLKKIEKYENDLFKEMQNLEQILLLPEIIDLRTLVEKSHFYRT